MLTKNINISLIILTSCMSFASSKITNYSYDSRTSYSSSQKAEEFSNFQREFSVLSCDWEGTAFPRSSHHSCMYRISPANQQVVGRLLFINNQTITRTMAKKQKAKKKTGSQRTDKKKTVSLSLLGKIPRIGPIPGLPIHTYRNGKCVKSQSYEEYMCEKAIEKLKKAKCLSLINPVININNSTINLSANPETLGRELNSKLI